MTTPRRHAASRAQEADHSGTAASSKPRVRDRIFETACDLFYQHGIRDVGVDQIATEAGTNKMSFYRSFASKDELVAKYLEQKANELWLWWDDRVRLHAGDPRRQILALFEGISKIVCSSTSRGCALANAAVELAAEDHPGRRVVLAKKREMRRRFRELAVATGAENPEELGDALMLLMEGAYLSRLTLSSQGPASHVGPVALRLLESYTRKT
ncbi:MAG: TetR/AcrR family transcriptional regulator [Steroidobacteraceae bacterium]|jgi:AcrR family transcriptional regulator